MKNTMKKIITKLCTLIFMGGTLLAPAAMLPVASVYAADGESCTCESGETGTLIEGAIIKDVCDCGHGEGVLAVLQIVVTTLRIGVGIFAVIGISVVGIQYLTAGGNEEQTRKAKRRLIEIVIGVAAYVLIDALLSWLIPNFKPNGF